jgi:hypothetical protein
VTAATKPEGRGPEMQSPSVSACGQHPSKGASGHPPLELLADVEVGGNYEPITLEVNPADKTCVVPPH